MTDRLELTDPGGFRDKTAQYILRALYWAIMQILVAKIDTADL